MPYRLSALAEQDLDEIWSYVAEDASPTTKTTTCEKATVATINAAVIQLFRYQTCGPFRWAPRLLPESGHHSLVEVPDLLRNATSRGRNARSHLARSP